MLSCFFLKRVLLIKDVCLTFLSSSLRTRSSSVVVCRIFAPHHNGCFVLAYFAWFSSRTSFTDCRKVLGTKPAPENDFLWERSWELNPLQYDLKFWERSWELNSPQNDLKLRERSWELNTRQHIDKVRRMPLDKITLS